MLCFFFISVWRVVLQVVLISSKVATEYYKIYSVYSIVYEQFKVNLIPSRLRANAAQDTQPFVRFLASERTTEVTSLNFLSLPPRLFQETWAGDISTAKILVLLFLFFQKFSDLIHLSTDMGNKHLLLWSGHCEFAVLWKISSSENSCPQLDLLWEYYMRDITTLPKMRYLLKVLVFCIIHFVYWKINGGVLFRMLHQYMWIELFMKSIAIYIDCPCTCI